jgi:hypothetical protein
MELHVCNSAAELQMVGWALPWPVCMFIYFFLLRNYFLPSNCISHSSRSPHGAINPGNRRKTINFGDKNSGLRILGVLCLKQECKRFECLQMGRNKLSTYVWMWK